MHRSLLLGFVCLSVVVGQFAFAEPQELVVEAVVASVNGEPITLREVCSRLNPPRALDVTAAARDGEARYALDTLIREKLISEETRARHISVSNAEIDTYMDEIATQNQLSRDGFETALKEQGRELSKYREQIELEILRSKLTSALMRAGVGITDKEIKEYIQEHPALSKSGSKLKLRQIFIARGGRSEYELKRIMDEITERLQVGDDFEELARKYSESAEAASGGLLGILVEEDLSPEIFDGVFGVAVGETSKTVETTAGLHLFFVEERFTTHGDSPDNLIEEVRRILHDHKLQAKMQGFFADELYKLHAVDKKI